MLYDFEQYQVTSRIPSVKFPVCINEVGNEEYIYENIEIEYMIWQMALTGAFGNIKQIESDYDIPDFVQLACFRKYDAFVNEKFLKINK